jgi:hypothetical protein
MHPTRRLQYVRRAECMQYIRRAECRFSDGKKCKKTGMHVVASMDCDGRIPVRCSDYLDIVQKRQNSGVAI